jgi:hypothetical protein
MDALATQSLMGGTRPLALDDMCFIAPHRTGAEQIPHT